MASAVTKKGPAPTEVARRPVAFLFELEGPIVNGRAMLFGACRKVLAERDGELTDVLFLRCCLNTGPVRFAEALLGAVGKKRLSPEKFAAEIQEAYVAALLADRVKIAPVFAKMLAKLRAQNVSLGCLSSLGSEAAEQLVKKLELDAMSVKTFCADPAAESFPSPDAWLKVAKTRGVPPGGCVVLASSEHSCRAALAGRMFCVACPDKFTAFQDFGGVDRLFQTFDEEAAGAILQLASRA